MGRARLLAAILAVALVACAAPPLQPAPTPTILAEPGPPPVALPSAVQINLDRETQALITRAKRTVFLVPFSHWDTDWHQTFEVYAGQADINIGAAIKIGLQNPRFRYTVEQVLFAQHFWEAHPERRADFAALVQRRQISFAWGGITQPDTSLVAPTIQVRNLQLGQDWLAQTFGVQSHTAWQSDAFGNSAALPIVLNQAKVPYLYMGRGRGLSEQRRRGSLFPHAFYWASPLDPSQRVLAAYVFYSDAWGAIAQLTDVPAQLAALHAVAEREFALTSSKYIFLPMGADITSPQASLPALVEGWNAADPDTALVMADPETAFQYLATQPLPQFTTDFNPIWQAFYGTRPAAKIADKESEYYLTAADKFGLIADTPQSTAWYTATVNAHYDNIAAVGYDSVWQSSQQPRYAQTLATAARDLSQTLAQVADGTGAPLVVFNPSSWERSEVIELRGAPPDLAGLPQTVQRLGPDQIAVWAADIPSIGYRAPPGRSAAGPAHPAAATQEEPQVTMSNGLVSVTLDGERGGTFSYMAATGGPEMLAGPGDDLVYLDDHGDVYGAFFGEERARASQVAAQLRILADGPLIARAQSVIMLGGQPITKTVTLRADSPQIEVQVEIAALPETTAIVQTPTTRRSATRTDDLGFAAYTHVVDNSPIISGTITYRREVFSPIMAWGDVSSDGAGLALLTHGLQGLGGSRTLNLMLLREVSDGGRPTSEGLSEHGIQTLHYAYLPHAGTASEAKIWQAATSFNQPLIPVWRTGTQIQVQLPFHADGVPFAIDPAARAFPASLSLMSADHGIIADLYRRNGQIEALVLNFDPQTPVTVSSGGAQTRLPAQALMVMPFAGPDQPPQQP